MHPADLVLTISVHNCQHQSRRSRDCTLLFQMRERAQTAGDRALLDLRGDWLVPGGNTPRDTPLTALSTDRERTGWIATYTPHTTNRICVLKASFTRTHHDTAFCPEEDKEEACQIAVQSVGPLDVTIMSSPASTVGHRHEGETATLDTCHGYS